MYITVYIHAQCIYTPLTCFDTSIPSFLKFSSIFFISVINLDLLSSKFSNSIPNDDNCSPISLLSVDTYS